MKIGIAAATSFEIQPTINFLVQAGSEKLPHEFLFLITGIGSLASAYHLTHFIGQQSPGYVLQAGIGGSFTKELSIGETVLIKEEVLGDLGAEENNSFTDLFDMGLMEPSVKPFTERRLVNPHLGQWQQYGLRQALGVTVNEITTQPSRIKKLHDDYHAEVESMEGAALHYVCLQENIPFIQFRAISNFVGDRDKMNWKIGEAIENLNRTLIAIIQQLP